MNLMAESSEKNEFSQVLELIFQLPMISLGNESSQPFHFKCVIFVMVFVAIIFFWRTKQDVQSCSNYCRQIHSIACHSNDR